MVLIHIFTNECGGFCLFKLLQCWCFPPFTYHFIFCLLPLKNQRKMTKKKMHTGRDSTGIKHKGKINYIPFCFLVLSTTKRKMEEDPGCFHSFKYWIWFGGGDGRETVCLGLKHTLASSPSEGCPGARAGLPTGWQAHDVSEQDPILPGALSLSRGWRWQAVPGSAGAEQSSPKRSWQRCWANLGEPSSLVSRAQGSA